MEDLTAMLKIFWAHYNAPLPKSCVMWFSLQQELFYHNNSVPSLPDIISKWSLCPVPFLSIRLPWKSFLLVTAHSALLLLERGLRGRSPYSPVFERWLWPVPAFFVLSCHTEEMSRSQFTVLVLISAFQKGVFCKGHPLWRISKLFFMTTSESVFYCTLKLENSPFVNDLWRSTRGRYA